MQLDFGSLLGKKSLLEVHKLFKFFEKVKIYLWTRYNIKTFLNNIGLCKTNFPHKVESFKETKEMLIINYC